MRVPSEQDSKVVVAMSSWFMGIYDLKAETCALTSEEELFRSGDAKKNRHDLAQGDPFGAAWWSAPLCFEYGDYIVEWDRKELGQVPGAPFGLMMGALTPPDDSRCTTPDSDTPSPPPTTLGAWNGEIAAIVESPVEEGTLDHFGSEPTNPISFFEFLIDKIENQPTQTAISNAEEFVKRLKQAVELDRSGASRVYLKKYGSRTHIIFKGNPRVRKILTSARYGIANPKVHLFAGKGIKEATRIRGPGGNGLALVVMSTIEIVEYIASDQKDFAELLSKLLTGGVKVVVASIFAAGIVKALAVSAGALLSAGAATAAIPAGIVMAGTFTVVFVVGMALDYLDDRVGAADWLRDQLRTALDAFDGWWEDIQRRPKSKRKEGQDRGRSGPVLPSKLWCEAVETFAAAIPEIRSDDFFVVYRGSEFLGDPVLAHVGFLAALERINEYAKSHGVEVYVTHSFRHAGQVVRGAVVKPAGNSNHLAGHAIDMNLRLGRGHFNSTHLQEFASLPLPVRSFLEDIRADSILFWGGDLPGKGDPVHIDDRLNVLDPARYHVLRDRAQKLASEGALSCH